MNEREPIPSPESRADRLITDLYEIKMKAQLEYIHLISEAEPGSFEQSQLIGRETQLISAFETVFECVRKFGNPKGEDENCPTQV